MVVTLPVNGKNGQALANLRSEEPPLRFRFMAIKIIQAWPDPEDACAMCAYTVNACKVHKRPGGGAKSVARV